MLYFIATPIGNLKEITYAAIEMLKNVDCIYAENPRHSLVLLNAYNIQKPVFEYNKHTEQQKSVEIIDKLKSGQSIALLSDAGTPLISDPGDVLRQLLITHNIPFTLIGGTCAAINALILSGLNAASFCMAGFLPTQKKQREDFIEKFVTVQATLIFYIAVHDIKKDIAFLKEYLGKRKAALVREISKKFEQVIRFNLSELPDFTQKGEFVLVVEGLKATEQSTGDIDKSDIKTRLQALISAGIDKKQAIKLLSAQLNLSKSIIYNVSIEL